MKYINYSIICLLLAACASTPPSDRSLNIEQPINLTSLPPQNLNPGECGLFIWSSGERQNFIGFESQAEVKLLEKGQVVNASRQDVTGLEAEERIYKLSKSESLTLTLRKEANITEGQRFIGRFTSETDDGWERILPVVAVLSCLPREPSRS